MGNKTKPGLTFSIPEIMEIIERKYGDRCELRLTNQLQAFIEDCSLVLVKEFNNLEKLYLWVAKTRTELDEQEAEQSAANDKINHESANVDIMKLKF